MKTRFEQAANAFRDAFEERLRDNGEAFYCLEDDAPDWMRDAIFAAHENGERLPDDYIYNACHSAACHIADTCDGADDDDASHEFADSFVSVYNGERAAWLAMHLGNAEYVDNAIVEGLASLEDGICNAIGTGMYQQAIDIFGAIYSAIDDAADDMPAPFVAGWNMPGYMPEASPEEFDTFDDAKRFIIDELKRMEDDHGAAANDARDTNVVDEFERLERLAEDFCHAAEDVNLKSSPFNIQVDNYVYWVADNEQ